MKFGVADYGMNVWYGGCYDTAERLADLKAIGYDGLERIEAASPSEAVYKAAEFRKLGMDFATCHGPNIECNIKWTAALGKTYVWTQVTGKDFDTYCRQVNEQARIAAKYGVAVGIHNHLGSLVEKDTTKTSPVKNPKWYDCGYFTTLGLGNIGQDNAAVLTAAVAAGFDGWVFVETVPIKVGIAGIGRAGWGMHCCELEGRKDKFPVTIDEGVEVVRVIDAVKRGTKFAAKE